MKILITGIAGFIGYHLSKKLLEMNFELVGVDNLNNYYDQQLKYDRLNELGINLTAIDKNSNKLKITNGNLTFIKGDIEDIEVWSNFINSENITHVIHLAAQAGVRYSIKNPMAYISSNIVGFINVLEFCRNNRINYLLYASSSSVYGVNSIQPFSENERCDKPISLYAATKRSNELMAQTYFHLFGIKSIGLRFFTVYGPWGRPDMAPILFANAASKCESINIYNHGNQSRDFTYIDDIINGIILVFKNKEKVVNGAEVFNIGNGNPINLLDFVNVIEKEIGYSLKKVLVDAQPGDVEETYADISKLSKAVNYKPTVNILEGVKNFIDWYKAYYITQNKI